MLCLLQIHEPVSVKAFTTEGAIEALDEGVVGRFARSREVDLRAVTIGPQVHRLTGELAAVVTEQHLRHAAVELQPVQRAHNVISF